MTSRSERPRWAPQERYEHPGLTAALAALRAGKKKPDGYRPPTSTFPGARERVIPGQLDLYGNVHDDGA